MKKNTIYIDKFESAQKFLYALETRKLRKDIESQAAGYQESEFMNKFSGTKNAEEAKNLLKFGYMEGLEAMREEYIKIKANNQGEANKRKIYNDFSGVVPCVGAYLAGSPCNMINIKTQPDTAKILRIYINAMGDTSQGINFFANAGANILTLINAIERQRINTEIYIVIPYRQTTGKRLITGIMQLNIKKAADRFNPLRLSFPLCHPSFIRRFWFRWLETSNFKRDASWFENYGLIATLPQLNEALQLQSNEIVIDSYLAQDYNKLIELVEKINIL